MKRTMTLVLNNGASINLSTMLQTSKPLKLTQVSICSIMVNAWQCNRLSALQYVSCCLASTTTLRRCLPVMWALLCSARHECRCAALPVSTGKPLSLCPTFDAWHKQSSSANFFLQILRLDLALENCCL